MEACCRFVHGRLPKDARCGQGAFRVQAAPPKDSFDSPVDIGSFVFSKHDSRLPVRPSFHPVSVQERGRPPAGSRPGTRTACRLARAFRALFEHGANVRACIGACHRRPTFLQETRPGACASWKRRRAAPLRARFLPNASLRHGLLCRRQTSRRRGQAIFRRRTRRGALRRMQAPRVRVPRTAKRDAGRFAQASPSRPGPSSTEAGPGAS